MQIEQGKNDVKEKNGWDETKKKAAKLGMSTKNNLTTPPHNEPTFFKIDIAF